MLIANAVLMGDIHGGWKALDTAFLRDHLHAATAMGRMAAAAKAVELGYGIEANAPTGLYNQGRFNSFESLSCASSRFCVAVDDSGEAFIYKGTAWGPPTQLDRFSSPSGGQIMVSCPTISFCAVADGNGNAYTYNGATWTKPTKFYSATKLDGPTWLSCAASTLCVLTDTVGNVMT